mmetsp:Transcript_17017/g.54251  ORF Transcript_17017/g.54251 Transcript_17017/m.54251 type:complete len:434 (-) Transcript_17017:1044-2345(-)
MGHRLEFGDVALECEGVGPRQGIPQGVLGVHENLLELHGVAQHHGLLARGHLRRDVVVEVRHLLEHEAVAVELAGGLDLVEDVPLHREAEARKLPHLPEEGHELVVVVQLHMAVGHVNVHQLPALLQLDVVEALVGVAAPLVVLRLFELVDVPHELLAVHLEHPEPLPRSPARRVLPARLEQRPEGVDRGPKLLLHLQRPREVVYDGGQITTVHGAVHRALPVHLAAADGREVVLEVLEVLVELRHELPALRRQRLGHDRPLQEGAVLTELAEHLVRLRHGGAAAVPVLAHRGREGGDEDVPKELPQFLAEARLHRHHALLILRLSGSPRGLGILAHVQGLQHGEGREDQVHLQGRGLVAGEKLVEFLVHVPHLQDLVQPVPEGDRHLVGRGPVPVVLGLGCPPLRAELLEHALPPVEEAQAVAELSLDGRVG